MKRRLLFIALLAMALFLAACRAGRPGAQIPTVAATVVDDVSPTPEQVATETVEPPATATVTVPATAAPLPTATVAPATSTATATVAPATATATNALPTSSVCSDAAAFVADVTVPDDTRFQPGVQFEKIWRIRNMGTCTWNVHYTLAFRVGERMGAASDHFSVPGPVAPGDTVDVSMMLTSPSTPGSYTGYWELENPLGRRFGLGNNNNPLFVRIVVESDRNASIRGLVWYDSNGNSRFDGNEGLDGVNVLLFGNPNCSVQVGRTTTVIGGAYAFYGLSAGTYCVVVTDDAHPVTESKVELSPGEEAVDINMPWPISTGTISGVVYQDLNNNQQRDGNEPGVSGRDIWLMRGDCSAVPALFTTVSNRDGAYSFSGVTPGRYCVALRNPGGHEDVYSLVLGDGEIYGGANLRAAISGGPGGSISGRLWNDFCTLTQDGHPVGNCVNDATRGWIGNGLLDTGEGGLGGVTIRLLPGPCGTDNPEILARVKTTTDGSYSFSGLEEGDYCVSMNAAADGNEAILLPGDWTYPQPGIWYHSIVLGRAEQRTGINFGWDYQLQ